MNYYFWTGLLNFWYLFILVFIAGILITLFFPKKAKIWIHVLFGRIFLLKSYWIFVLIFSSFSALGYYLIFQYIPTSNKSFALDIYNEILTLVFAIFVGNYAFIQVKESRFDKLKENAYTYLGKDDDEINKAIKCYEECIKINNNDFDVWSNLMEAYLIVKKNEIFEDKMYHFKRILKSPKDWLTLYLLLATKELLTQHLSEARLAIVNLVNYNKENPTALRSFSWSFKEVMNSDMYSVLEPTTKRIYLNLSKYLSKQLSPENKVRFESGDYELIPITTSQA